jgi:F0F1-type ATP synthase delta subunit
LKEELRKLERAEKRQDMNIEYLKNIVLMFFEAESDEARKPLITVVSQVLQLSPEEIERLRKRLSAAGLLQGWFS